jgi:hypothetical protein
MVPIEIALHETRDLIRRDTGFAINVKSLKSDQIKDFLIKALVAR